MIMMTIFAVADDAADNDNGDLCCIDVAAVVTKKSLQT